MRLKDVVFHPHEIAFVGYSGSGKTTLIEKLIKQLSQNHKIGYIKHDAHQFEMDKSGKDTDRNFQAGSQQVFINDQTQWALRGHGEMSPHLLKQNFLDLDFVLVEGFKNSKLPKFVVVDENQEILSLMPDLEQVVGLIYADKPVTGSRLPQFHRDDSVGIAAFILQRFDSLKAPVYGLVVAGGKSTRMKTDKGALNYNGKSQTEHLFELMGGICEKVFVSTRQEQAELEHLAGLPRIDDLFLDMGPMGGILSAQQKYPGAAFLVVAVDLPYVDKETLKYLMSARNIFKVATCFLNPEKKWREPLLTLWEPKSFSKLLQAMGEGRTCPRKVLYNSEVKELELPQQKALINANTPDDYKSIAADLKGAQV